MDHMRREPSLVMISNSPSSTVSLAENNSSIPALISSRCES